MTYNAEIPSSQFNVGLSQMNVTDLNDDCLLHIFRYLNTSDLGTVSDVCQSFQEVAARAFKLQWKAKTIRLCNDSKKGRLESSTILRQFGSMLQKVNIVFGERSNKFFFNLIMEKCSLHLIEVDFSCTSFNNQLEIILNKESICKFVNKFPNLKVLQFRASADQLIDPQCIEQQFSSLENFSLFGWPFENRNVKNFMISNPQVKNLSLLYCNDVENSRNLIQLIDENLPHIEQLGLWMHGTTNVIEYQPGFLKNLKRLNVHNYGPANNMNHLSISNESVEEMVFEVDICDEELVDVICQYKEMKKLAIRTYMDSSFDCKLLRKLGKHLSKLQEIEISSLYENLNYKDIIDFVHGTKQLVEFVMRDTCRKDITEDAKEFQRKLHSAVWNVACCQSNDRIRIFKSTNNNRN